MSQGKSALSRSWSPFDDSARERLRRTGLLSMENMPNRDAVTVVAQLYAGLFYDALCDFYGEIEHVNAVCRDLLDRTDTKNPRLPFLAICSAYDAMYLALPEPIWWMAGDLGLITQYAPAFIERLAEFAKKSEVM